MTPPGFTMLERVARREASTACPVCASKNAEVFDAHVGTSETTPITGTIMVVYQCADCHFRAFQADALRADGVVTDDQVAPTIRRAAERYTQAARVLTGWTP